MPQAVRQWMDAEVDPVADPDEFLEHGQIVSFGEERLEVRLHPDTRPVTLSLWIMWGVRCLPAIHFFKAALVVLICPVQMAQL